MIPVQGHQRTESHSSQCSTWTTERAPRALVWLSLTLALAQLAAAFSLPLVGGFQHWGPALLATSPAALVLALTTLGCYALLGAQPSPRKSTSHVALILPILLTLAALGLTALVPDTQTFWGDSALRLGSTHTGQYARTFPQGMPLDALVFADGLRGVAALFGTSLSATALAFALLSHLLLMVLLVMTLRSQRLAGSTNIVFALVTLIGPYAIVFSGMNRDTVLLLPTAFGFLLALAAYCTKPSLGRLLPTAVLLVVGTLIHRSAVGLFPLYAYTLLARRRTQESSQPSVQVRLLVTATTLVGAALLVVPVIATFDRAHHLTWLEKPAALPLLSPAHLSDLANLMLIMFPTAPGLLLAVWWARRARISIALALLLLPVGVALVVVPQQGLPRDLDVYALASFIVQVTVGLAIGLTYSSTPTRALRLVTSLLVGSSMMSLIAIKRLPARQQTLENYLAYLLAADTSTADKRLPQMADYAATLAERRGSLDRASALRELAYRHQPTLRNGVAAGRALLRVNRADEAQVVFADLVARDSSSVVAAIGLRAASWRSGDSAHFRLADRSMQRMLTRSGGLHIAKQILRQLPELATDRDSLLLNY